MMSYVMVIRGVNSGRFMMSLSVLSVVMLLDRYSGSCIVR